MATYDDEEPLGPAVSEREQTVSVLYPDNVVAVHSHGTELNAIHNYKLNLVEDGSASAGHNLQQQQQQQQQRAANIVAADFANAAGSPPSSTPTVPFVGRVDSEPVKDELWQDVEQAKERAELHTFSHSSSRDSKSTGITQENTESSDTERREPTRLASPGGKAGGIRDEDRGTLDATIAPPAGLRGRFWTVVCLLVLFFIAAIGVAGVCGSGMCSSSSSSSRFLITPTPTPTPTLGPVSPNNSSQAPVTASPAPAPTTAFPAPAPTHTATPVNPTNAAENPVAVSPEPAPTPATALATPAPTATPAPGITPVRTTPAPTATPALGIAPVLATPAPMATPAPSQAPVLVTPAPMATPAPSQAPVLVTPAPMAIPAPSQAPALITPAPMATPAPAPAPSQAPVLVSPAPTATPALTPAPSRAPALVTPAPTTTPHAAIDACKEDFYACTARLGACDVCTENALQTGIATFNSTGSCSSAESLGCGALNNCMDECIDCHDEAVEAVNCMVKVIDPAGECNIQCGSGAPSNTPGDTGPSTPSPTPAPTAGGGGDGPAQCATEDSALESCLSQDNAVQVDGCRNCISEFLTEERMCEIKQACPAIASCAASCGSCGAEFLNFITCERGCLPAHDCERAASTPPPPTTTPAPTATAT